MLRRLQTLLKDDLTNNFIEIMNSNDGIIEFRLVKPIFDFGIGRIVLLKDGSIDIKIMSDRKVIEIDWNGHGVYQSICSNYQVKHLCSAEVFCQTSISTLRKSKVLICRCEHTVTTEKRVIAVDLDYIEIPRKRGVVVTEKCTNLNCEKWLFTEYAIAVEDLNSKYDILNAVSMWCQALGIQLPQNNSIVDSYGINPKQYYGSTSRRFIQSKKQKISAMKGKSLDEIKKEYYKL